MWLSIHCTRLLNTFTHYIWQIDNHKPTIFPPAVSRECVRCTFIYLHNVYVMKRTKSAKNQHETKEGRQWIPNSRYVLLLENNKLRNIESEGLNVGVFNNFGATHSICVGFSLQRQWRFLVQDASNIQVEEMRLREVRSTHSLLLHEGGDETRNTNTNSLPSFITTVKTFYSWRRQHTFIYNKNWVHFLY